MGQDSQGAGKAALTVLAWISGDMLRPPLLYMVGRGGSGSVPGKPWPYGWLVM